MMKPPAPRPPKVKTLLAGKQQALQVQLPLQDKYLLFGAFMLRLLMVIYGEWQDANMLVKYTDIDYQVFTDASRFLAQGQSPYERSTYRYSPILALLLLPNIWLHPVWGKLLFISCDILVGICLGLLLARARIKNSTVLLAVWLLNPLTLTVSTRGNADVMVTCAVIGAIYCLTLRKLTLAALLYGFSVHFKMYPIIYAPSFIFYLHQHFPDSSALQTKYQLSKYWGLNTAMFKFTIVSASLFFYLLLQCYYWYGYEFLYETYLYHFIRKDPRHNFSVYFYNMYLDASSSNSHQFTENPFISKAIAFIAFCPQLLLVFCIAIRYAAKDLPFCFFLQTLAFVVFNKVCTAQYYVWYLAFLPIVIPSLRFTTKQGIQMAVAWFVTEVHWLFWAYQLEFLGENTFFQVRRLTSV